MHQKWYTAYEEAIRVPLIVYSPKLFPQPREIDTLTSHIDLLPTRPYSDSPASTRRRSARSFRWTIAMPGP